MKWAPRFIDDNKGEAVVAGALVPAARAQAIITRALPDLSYAPVWQGYLDDDGCSRPLALQNNTTYRVTLLTNMLLTADTGDFGVRVGQKIGAPEAHGYDRFVHVTNASVSSVTVPFWFVEPETGVSAAISSMFAQGAYEGARRGVTYQAYADQACPNGASACYSNALYIGPNGSQPQSHDSQWKVVILHELGHGVQDTTIGWPGQAIPYGDDVATNPGKYCRCDHVKSVNDRAHCLQSREETSDAQIEAYAHYFSSRTWSGSDSTSCTFPYYKEVLNPGPGDFPTPLSFAPPWPANCAATVKWMESRCIPDQTNNGRGVEWDWLNFFHHISSNDVSGTVSHGDIMLVYRQACGNVPCTGPRTYQQLQAAALTLFGSGTSRYNNFNLALANYGVNH